VSFIPHLFTLPLSQDNHKMFSKSCEYAIKACLFIAQHKQDGDCVSIKKIAKGINAPEHFIAKILQQLSTKKVITSVKGTNGGFYMTDTQIQKPVIDIVLLIDGDNLLSNCVLGLESCGNESPCPMHFEYQKIKNSIRKMIENNSILDFNELIASQKAFLITR
jgi:Rrf2 family protein